MERQGESLQQREKIRLGDLLTKAKLVTTEQLNSALAVQKKSGEKLGKVLIEMGVINEKQLCETLGFQLGVSFVDLAHMALDPVIVNIIPEEIAFKHTIIAVDKISDETICVAMVNPLDIVAMDDIKAVTGFNIKVMISMQSAIEKSISEYYKIDELIFDTLKDVASARTLEIISDREKDSENIVDILKKSNQPPIIRLLDFVFADAIKSNASDIHIEPQVNNVEVRFRIDGILHDRTNVPKYIQESLISRVKVISELDIAEKRAPQDGRVRIKIHEKDIDLRVSTLPTIYGEKVVMRILDKTKLPLDLKKLGVDEETHDILNSFLQHTKGMIFVTGPTGSGKTTTLYAAIGQVRSRTKNIITVEDPVEYAIDGINQVQVNERAGVTFASGLRSILRQDPDVILVGEVRDRDTAQIAFESALTGHLVLSTLHTSSAAGSIIRLLELGIEPYLIAESVIGIVAQRLVRKLCSDCKVLGQPDKSILDKLSVSENEIAGKKLYKAVGCNLCSNTGYRDRIAIFEILKMDQQIKNQITDRISEKVLMDIGKMSGMRTLREDGIAKALVGITTFEEVLRVTYEEKETAFNCPRCGKTLELSFSICPYCQQDLTPKECKGCGKKLDPLWKLCPYCRAAQ